MKVTITFQYEDGTFDSEYLNFDTWDDAEYYADKKKVEYKAINVWVR